MKSSFGFSIACLTLACGCSTLDVSKAKSFWPARQEKPQQPSSVVAIWSEGVAHQAGAPAIRGFAGRVIFYDAEGTKPVKVDGTLTVYAFDEGGRDRSDTRPDRKYIFTPEQLEKHYDPVKVGPAYAIWIPCDRADGFRKETSLIVRFTPCKGSLVVGEMAKLVLNGPPPPTVAGPAQPTPRDGVVARNDPMVRPTAYESPIPGRPGEPLAGEPGGSGIRSTTIQLPENLARRMATARPTGAERIGRTTVVPGGVASSYAGPLSTGGAAAASRAPSTAMQASAATGPAGAATSQASPPQALPGVHSSPARPRVPGVTIAPQVRDHGGLRPFPGASPYAPPATLPAAPPTASASTSSGVPWSPGPVAE